MTPYTLLQFFAVIATGLFLIGLSVFFICCLFVLTLAWVKRPAVEAEKAETTVTSVYPVQSIQQANG